MIERCVVDTCCGLWRYWNSRCFRNQGKIIYSLMTWIFLWYLRFGEDEAFTQNQQAIGSLFPSNQH